MTGFLSLNRGRISEAGTAESYWESSKGCGAQRWGCTCSQLHQMQHIKHIFMKGMHILAQQLPYMKGTELWTSRRKYSYWAHTVWYSVARIYKTV